MTCGKTSPAGPGCHPFEPTGEKVEGQDVLGQNMSKPACVEHECDLGELHTTLHHCGGCGYHFLARGD